MKEDSHPDETRKEDSHPDEIRKEDSHPDAGLGTQFFSVWYITFFFVLKTAKNLATINCRPGKTQFTSNIAYKFN